MGSSKGWIKLYRDLREHWVFDDPLLLKIWIYLLLTANHEPKKLARRYGSVDVQRGQFFSSNRLMSEYLKVSKTTIARKLELLQEDGMIYVDPAPGKGTLITIRNYERYQGSQTDDWDSVRDTEWDKEWDRNEDKPRTESRTESRHKQEYIKNEEALENNEEEKGRPGDPDYFEEVW